jgi:predicted nucleic acid-binding protein
VILVDCNILMYAAGKAHPHKRPCVEFLEKIAEGAIDAAVDAEVLQEILHRYRAIRRWTEGRQVYDLTRRLFPVVIPITIEILDRARVLLDLHSGIMARDALHAAVVETQSLEALYSYDRDFDAITTVERREP